MRRLALLVTLLVVFATTSRPALGAEPSPSGLPLMGVSSDVRSGEAPGFAGGPLEVLVAVVLLGLTTALVTVTIARVARPR